MTISKFFALATVFVAAFTLGSCSKDDDEEVNNSKADGHEYVDLGLPSGTLWATCNVGASKPEEYGSYLSVNLIVVLVRLITRPNSFQRMMPPLSTGAITGVFHHLNKSMNWSMVNTPILSGQL